MSSMNTIKFCTFNVKGIHHPIKRKKILSFLKKDKIQIAFLQETHLVAKEHIKLKRDWVGQAYYSSFSSNSRGVAILIHKATPFVLKACKKDPDGRHIIVHGTVYGVEITMTNTYAPSPPSCSFWTRVGTDLEEYKCPLTLLGGDFNCSLDHKLDRTPTDAHKANMGTSLVKMLDDVNLIDIWRTLNPSVRDFTFYSNPHNSYSRIDYFFIPPQITGQVNTCSIGSIHISDHAPVYLEMNICDVTASTRRWRFPSYILNDKDFKKKMEAELDLFFDINDNGETNPENLWESAKAYIRGFIISYMSHRKRTNFIKTQAIRAELNSVLNEKASTFLFYQKQRMYEYGNKPSKYLARLLNQKQTYNTIAGIRDSEGKRHFDRKNISSVFVSFYKSLNKSENKNAIQNITQTPLYTTAEEQAGPRLSSLY
uniref:exodeoxyribonuclease III n=1 Tax=Amphiprion percula TaxID=161767 RepID=A0A3P8UB30_AMPPE